MSVEVTVNEALYEKLDAKKLSSAMKKALTEQTIQLEGECVDYSPHDTGYLQQSWSYSVDGGQRVAKAQIKNGAKYWQYVEFGTRYQPAQGYVQRAIEVNQPAEKFIARFQQYYKPGGK